MHDLGLPRQPDRRADLANPRTHIRETDLGDGRTRCKKRGSLVRDEALVVLQLLDRLGLRSMLRIRG